MPKFNLGENNIGITSLKRKITNRMLRGNIKYGQNRPVSETLNDHKKGNIKSSRRRKTATTGFGGL